MLIDGKINIVEMSILPKAIFRFNAISVKEIEQRKKNKAGGIKIPDFKF